MFKLVSGGNSSAESWWHDTRGADRVNRLPIRCVDQGNWGWLRTCDLRIWYIYNYIYIQYIIYSIYIYISVYTYIYLHDPSRNLRDVILCASNGIQIVKSHSQHLPNEVVISFNSHWQPRHGPWVPLCKKSMPVGKPPGTRVTFPRVSGTLSSGSNMFHEL
jgi:hypothetical protein